METFKIKEIGINTSDLTYPTFPFKADWIFTNISSMNEHLVKKMIKVSQTSKLVTYVDYLDGIDRQLLFHVQQLEVECIDLLLVSSKCNFSTHKEILREVIEMGIVRNIGVYAEIGTTTADLEKIKESLGFMVVGMEINPKNFPKSVISWCSSAEGISIFGFNPVPDNETVEEYSLPYLLSLSSVYSDVVILSDVDLSQNRYIDSLAGKEVPKKVYNLRETACAKKKKMAEVYPYLFVSGMYLPAYKDSLFDDIVLSKKKKDSVRPEPEEKDKVIPKIIDVFNDRYTPTDGIGKNHTSNFLPTLLHHLQLIYPDYKITYVPVGENVLIIDVYRNKIKRWFRKSIEEDRKSYIYHITDEDKIMFALIPSES